MNYFLNMKVGTKIVILVISLMACILSVSFIGIQQLSLINEESDNMYFFDVKALEAAKEANIALISASRAIRNTVLAPTMDLRESYKKSFVASVTKTKEELKKVEPLISSPNNKQLFNKVQSELEGVIPLQAAFLDKVGTISSEEIFKELVTLRQKVDIVDEDMTALGEAMSQEAAARSLNTTQIYEHGRLVNIVGLIIALLLGGSIGYATKRAIANPLVVIADKAMQVAHGDLEQRFNLSRKDELGLLADALEQMVENLRLRIAEAEQKSLEATEQSQAAAAATVEANSAKEKAEQGQKAILVAAESVEQVVNRLSTATEELSAQVEECSRSMDMQRERISSSATAMEEMNSTVLEVARNAGIASEGSDRAKNSAHEGETIVQQSVEAISTVQTDTLELRQNMEKLGQQAEAIGSIMTVISEIADQTNLLALNAAIEAARAGEAGRGFAVVADEVRKLAENTMSATKDVGSAIKGIQDGASQSISAVERTTKNLDTTTDLVKKSGMALTHIVTEAVQTCDQIGSIAAAAEQQSAASEEISRSLEEINHMANETATAMQQSAHAVSDLAQQSHELHELVNKLRNGDRATTVA